MQTKKLTKKQIPAAVEALKNGALVAFPTETVYGLGANALNETAVKKVYQVKGRPSDNPLIVHVNGSKMLEEYVEELPEVARVLIDTFWPGPLTLIFKAKKDSFSKSVTGGLDTVAFRMPNNQVTLEFIQRAGVPLVGPSANTSGKPSPTTANHVYHDLQGKIYGILDDGATQIGIESTVLDLTTKIPTILRPGAVTKEELETAIGTVKLDQHLINEEHIPKSPGMKYKHYAPNVPVFIVNGATKEFSDAIAWARKKQYKVGVFASQVIIDELDAKVEASYSFGENNVMQAAKYLFAGLRSLDEQEIEIIFAQGFPENLLGVAYMNRLKKAAGQKFF